MESSHPSKQFRGTLNVVKHGSYEVTITSEAGPSIVIPVKRTRVPLAHGMEVIASVENNEAEVIRYPDGREILRDDILEAYGMEDAPVNVRRPSKQTG